VFFTGRRVVVTGGDQKDFVRKWFETPEGPEANMKDDDALTRGGCANELTWMVVRRVYRQLKRDTTRAYTKHIHTHMYSSLHTTRRSNKLRINLTADWRRRRILMRFKVRARIRIYYIFIYGTAVMLRNAHLSINLCAKNIRDNMKLWARMPSDDKRGGQRFSLVTLAG